MSDIQTTAAIDVVINHRARPSVEARLTRTLWWLIAAMFATTAVGFPALGLRIDVSSNLALVGIVAFYVGVAVIYATVRRDEFILAAMTTMGQFFLVLLGGVFLTYAATAVAMPYRDAELYAIDQWLGFPRESLKSVVGYFPWVSYVLDVAYVSIQPQTIAIPFLLILMKQIPRLQRFVLAFGLALAMTAFIAVFVPAVAAYIYVDLAPMHQAAIPPGQYSHIVTLEALRSGAMKVIPLNDLEGLVTFPSFHTANAILFIWALWQMPYLRWVGLVINVLMILSTPITGQHYVTDLIGGTIVAFAAIFAAQHLFAPGDQTGKPIAQ